VNSRGLTTRPVPHAPGNFEIQFDFQRHERAILTSQGAIAAALVEPEPVAVFFFESLHSLGIAVEINKNPQEVADPIPLDEDYTHRSYDAEIRQ
jgi:Family of unknown function (DUF5996)